MLHFSSKQNLTYWEISKYVMEYCIWLARSKIFCGNLKNLKRYQMLQVEALIMTNKWNLNLCIWILELTSIVTILFELLKLKSNKYKFDNSKFSFYPVIISLEIIRSEKNCASISNLLIKYDVTLSKMIHN